MINWEPLMDGHVRGACGRVVVWIRLNREDKVTGIYVMSPGTMQKLVPKVERDSTLAGAKLWAQDTLNIMELENK
jgi:hypothetical protein